MKKPGIPAVNVQDPMLSSMLSAMKENIEIITGARPRVSQITQLEATATSAQIISKVNEIIARLNARGE